MARFQRLVNSEDGGSRLTEHELRQIRDLSSNNVGGAILDNPALKLIKRIKVGGTAEHADLLGELFYSKDLDELFQEPDMLQFMIEKMPILKSLKGVPEVAAKGADVTPEDVSSSSGSTSR